MAQPSLPDAAAAAPALLFDRPGVEIPQRFIELEGAALAPRGRMTRRPGVGHMIHHAAPTAVVHAVERLEALL